MVISRATIAVTAAVAFAAAGTGTALASDATSSATRATQECQPGTLKATTTQLGTEQAGMNHAGTFLKLTNTGNVTCVISGYAGLALEGSGHTALTTQTEHSDTYFAADPGRHDVTLQAGDSAYADLVWTHTGADTAAARYLQISPTGGNSHSTVAFKQDVDNGDLSVTAWSDAPPTI
ncbi:DUF4232 domain-containing protein [Streptomyces sp. NBC_00006]|uniref:DUF4232 domain-containing protein n=1 Tax=unclassified Streptomyces TaxID=2593676 RepID=UPI00225284A8|nr:MULTISPECIES: DUF4232 domain-containing protein [unclassified Streptomyces]MCX4827943.1 DUF4232 domain-containing protein [Streptomyces sp. NBC_01016]MCX5532702.1 DUF4232 domain-containing protein [Streptomyces sp. NBC_00006]